MLLEKVLVATLHKKPRTQTRGAAEQMLLSRGSAGLLPIEGTSRLTEPAVSFAITKIKAKCIYLEPAASSDTSAAHLRGRKMALRVWIDLAPTAAMQLKRHITVMPMPQRLSAVQFSKRLAVVWWFL